MENKMTAANCNNSAILPLIEGYKKFKVKHFEKTKAFDLLVQQGQKPKVLVIACCDSRVDPAILTNCNPGELFVVRNVANLVPPFDGNPRHHGTSAALEFGVMELGISDIIVLGHSHCGGINSLMKDQKNEDSSDFIAKWMDIAKLAKQKVLTQHPNCSLDQQIHYCEKESLLISLANLKTFPWINSRIAEKKLFLHAWYFNLNTGIIEIYDSVNNSFVPVHN